MHTTYRRLVTCTTLACVLVVGFGIMAEAGGPQERVSQMLDDLLLVLKDETLTTSEQRRQRRDRIAQVLSQHFDFEEMARRSLGHHWHKITPAQQREFLLVFSDLIEQSLVDTISSRSETESHGYGSVPSAIEYTREVIDPGAYASVQTAMAYPEELTKEEVEYLLLKRNGNWLVYDIVADGGSRLTNYRTQFDKIIRQESYADLMKRLQTSPLYREASPQGK